MLSGWPRGAVDSLCCSADVLTGSRPFAHSLAPLLTTKRTGVAEGDAGETGEVEGGEKQEESRKLGDNVEKGIGKRWVDEKGGMRNHRKRETRSRCNLIIE